MTDMLEISINGQSAQRRLKLHLAQTVEIKRKAAGPLSGR